MSNTDQFYVRICGCGLVHLSFGCAVVNVTSEVAIAITETLKEVAGELRQQIGQQQPSTPPPPAQPPLGENVIVGKF